MISALPTMRCSTSSMEPILLPQGSLGTAFFEVGPRPLRLALGLRHQRSQSLFAGRIAAGIQAVLVQRFFECVDLRARGLDFGLADLREVARPT